MAEPGAPIGGVENDARLRISVAAHCAGRNRVFGGKAAGALAEHQQLGQRVAADARRAVEHGAAAVYVSNHGGRQLDQDRGSISALPEIVEAVAGKAEIWIDGGFTRGSDVVKAIALGANAVGIGKLQAWALTAGGAAALHDCLEILETEIRCCMGLLGVNTLVELGKSHLAPARPVGPCHEMSAFPHLPNGGRLT